MSILMSNVCRACLSDENKAKLTEFSIESDTFKNFQALIVSEHPTAKLPTTFCNKCIAKITLATNFKQSSLDSEKYLLSFLQKINEEFKNSLSNFSGNRLSNDAKTSSIECEEQDLEYLLQEEEINQQQPQEIQKESPLQQDKPKVHTTRRRAIVALETTSKELPDDDVKKEKTFLSISNAYANATSSENEQRLDEANIFDDKEIYDIMEIEGNEDIYVDEAGNAILNDDDEEGEFILVNYKSSTDDLTQDKHYLVEGDEDDEDDKEEFHEHIEKRQRKKHVQRMPREIVDRYAQSTDSNQHICTKCVKVFSTRTNLIRHIQSHDGNKPYVCDICKKGFTQSGSLKQHMYIHSGERPYKCQFCDKAFTQGKTLKFHLRRHLDEKPFECSECNATFRQRDGLKRHLKSRHNFELKYERSLASEEKIIGLVSDEKESEKALEIIEEANDDENDKKMEF